ncbi:hypothetical protein H671_1g0878 [Cricetulus griseus]|nr:hypothetical protein H671_1g0878 [Cricetulus griseus]
MGNLRKTELDSLNTGDNGAAGTIYEATGEFNLTIPTLEAFLVSWTHLVTTPQAVLFCHLDLLLFFNNTSCFFFLVYLIPNGMTHLYPPSSQHSALSHM